MEICCRHLYQVSLLARSIRPAGELGSSAIPPTDDAPVAGDESYFAVISNKGAAVLANTEVKRQSVSGHLRFNYDC